MLTEIDQRDNAIEVKPQTKTIKYCLYARKSSEQDERQALSIEQQIKEMEVMAEHWGIKITEIRRESHSSKTSGTRPVFNKLIQDIQLGYFSGIIAWAPDRLSRNAGDLGILVDLMDQGRLVEIRTHGQTFTNSPNEKFLLMILGSQAKLENDNRGLNVIRGLKNKAAGGWRPGVSPIGYLNNGLGKDKIIVDPQRAPVIIKMFDKVAHQAYTGRDLKRWLDKTSFTTRNGKKLALSAIYRILRNPFYTGKFCYSAEWYKGRHKPIISKQLFEEVQIQLTVAPKSPACSKEFGFTRMLKCGACGTGITAEEKIKRIRKTGEVRRYVYYHCGRANDLDCEQPYIREADLMQQLITLIDQVPLDEIGAQDTFKQEYQRFTTFSSGILRQTKTETNLAKVNIRDYAKYVLQSGTKDEKREILSHLIGELYLKDQKIYIERKARSKTLIHTDSNPITI